MGNHLHANGLTIEATCAEIKPFHCFCVNKSNFTGTFPTASSFDKYSVKIINLFSTREAHKNYKCLFVSLKKS